MTNQALLSKEITIICCGMRRSGSTLQTKIVKEIVSHSESSERYKVIKEHYLTHELRRLISKSPTILVYSYRDIRDIVVSDMRLFNLKNSFIRTTCMGVVSDMVREYWNWNSYDNIISSRYEDFAFDIGAEVKRIADFLGILLRDEEVDAIESKCSKKRQSEICNSIQTISDKKAIFDVNFGYFKNHIGSGETGQWRRELKPSQVAFIEYVNYSWLIQMQYPLSQSRQNRYLFGAIGTLLMKASQLYRWLKKTVVIYRYQVLN